MTDRRGKPVGFRTGAQEFTYTDTASSDEKLGVKRDMGEGRVEAEVEYGKAEEKKGGFPWEVVPGRCNV